MTTQLRLSNARRTRVLRDPITGFLVRQQLLIDLAHALTPGSTPSVLAVFDLGGFADYKRVAGRRASNRLVSRLSKRFESSIGSSGTCYSGRQGEFCAIVHTLINDSGPVLETAAAAIRNAGQSAAISALFGAVILPGEGSEPIDVLMLADERLAIAVRGSGQKRIRLREG